MPESESAHFNLASIYAKCPDILLRDREKAIYHGRIACGLSNFKNPVFADLVATVYAEKGNFQEAERFETYAFGTSKNDEHEKARKKLEEYRSHLAK